MTLASLAGRVYPPLRHTPGNIQISLLFNTMYKKEFSEKSHIFFNKMENVEIGNDLKAAYGETLTVMPVISLVHLPPEILVFQGRLDDDRDHHLLLRCEV